MKNYHSLFGLLLASCVKFNINQVSATNIPTTFPELSSAGSVNVSDLHSLLANITSPGEIDPAFGFVPVFGADKLRAVPCLLSTVNFVLQLGLGDYKGSIPETTFLLDSHPQVEIKVVPDVDRGRIRRKYALWGLSIGIDLMMHNNDFRTAVFVLTYHGSGIGCILYDVPSASGPTPTDLIDAMHSLNQTHPVVNTTDVHRQVATDANISTVDATNDSELEVTFHLAGAVIKIYDIFIMAIDTIRRLSVHGRTREFRDFTDYMETANLVISTRQTDPPRTARDPPYFQIEWLMRALAQTPAYMLEQRSFREVDMELFVDEVKVGEVSLRRPVGGVELTQGSDGVSTS